MKKIMFLYIFASFAITVNAQTYCPHVFSCGESFTDPRDSIIYPTVQIGTQCWMVNNLNATKYVNGDSIQHITNNTSWTNLSTGAWCDYNNSSANGTTFGHLYNWYAVNDSRGLCPLGWYVPVDNDWNILFNFLGGYVGTELKANSSLWGSYPGTNHSGWTGLPGGFRGGGNGGNGSLNSLGGWGFWSYRLYAGSSGANECYLYNGPWSGLQVTNVTCGVSVRCVMGN